MSRSPVLTRRRLLLAGGGLGLIALAGASWSRLSAPPDGVQALDVTQAHARARDGDILLVDIRRPDEWAQTGVAAGALPLDMRRPDFLSVLAAERAQRGDPPVALICARGVRSRRLSAALAEAGITPVIDVPEGMLGSFAGPGWVKTGLPVDPAPEA